MCALVPGVQTCALPIYFANPVCCAGPPSGSPDPAVIVPRYRVETSRVPQAGKGLFIDEPTHRGRVIVAPDQVHTVWPEAKLRTYAEDSIEVESSGRRSAERRGGKEWVRQGRTWWAPGL